MGLLSLRTRITLKCAGLVALGSILAHAVPGLAYQRGGERGRIAGRHVVPDVAGRSVSRTRTAAMGYAAPSSAIEPQQRLEQKGMIAGSPLMIRIFKAESELEVWLRTQDRFELFATYPICFWSGTLGPKLREGDRQAPEGLYSIGNEQLHHNGARPHSFDIGYPNSLDAAEGRTGSNIWIHGGCGSIGCFAMTNPVMDEIFALGEQALAAGQDRFQVHIFPFRMTSENMHMHADSPWYPFWSNLKEAYDLFERTRIPPKVGMCGRRYVVEQGALEASASGLAAAAPAAPTGSCEEVAAPPLPVLSQPSAEDGAKAKRRRAWRHSRSRHATIHRRRRAEPARDAARVAVAFRGRPGPGGPRQNRGAFSLATWPHGPAPHPG
jgi:murein L,D-transpeptidase YafK